MIQNPSTLFESHILAHTDKPHYSFQFPRQTIRIHSSQKRRTPSSHAKTVVTPYKGPPPRNSTNNDFFQPLILTQQRHLRKSEPSLLEGIVKQVSIHPKKRIDTSVVLGASSSQNKKSSEIKMCITDTNKHHILRIPIRATKTDRIPVKSGLETERSWKSIMTRDTSKPRSSRKRVGDSLDAGLSEDRYSNIKFVKNDRSKSQCDIQYHITSADIIIPATDTRYPVIEEAMREYSLDFIPENSKYIICQNPLSQNYSVVFTEKSIPTCKECLVPICLELSYNCGFRVLCKSGYCSKEILYTSRLNNSAIQELWSYSPLEFPSMLHTERQGVSKMIQNGVYKHRDIARTLTDWKANSNKRPQTSFSPSRNQSQRRENQYSLPTSVYQTRLGGTRKSVDWRKYTESLRDTKNSFSRAKSPNRLDSFSASRNNSVYRNEESKDEVEDLHLKTYENK